MAVLTVPITLVQAAKQGDKVAFMSLLEPSLEPGYRLACGMLHDSQAAEDAVQEAAFKAWRKLGQLREGHELRPWFLGIVANECRTVRRSRWWSVLKWPKSEHPVETSPDSGLSGIELRRAWCSFFTGTSIFRWTRFQPSPASACMPLRAGCSEV